MVLINSVLNVKQGGGRNAGIRKSTAPYLMFVDADDWVTYDYVDKHYKAAIETDADIVIADYYQNDESGNTQICLMGKNLPIDTELMKHKYLECGGGVWTSIYKRHLFEYNNLFFPENIFYEDNAVMVSIFLSAKKIVKIDDCLYFYRQHPQSTTALKDNRFYERLKTAIMSIEHTKRLGLYAKYESGIKNAFFKLFYKNSIIGIYERFRPIPYDQIKYITSKVHDYLTPQELNNFINRCNRREKIVLKATWISPVLGLTAFRFMRRMSHIYSSMKNTTSD